MYIIITTLIYVSQEYFINYRVIRKATTFKTKSFPYYEELCMVFGKDRATGRNAETAADVVEDLDKGEDDIHHDDEAFNSVENMVGGDEAQSMYFSQASAVPQTQSHSQGSSKKKRKNTGNSGDAYEALKESSNLIAGVIEKASEHLSRAIGEDIMEKHSQLRAELERTTTISTIERHKAARLIMKDDATVCYFFSVPDQERDEWVKALLAGEL